MKDDPRQRRIQAEADLVLSTEDWEAVKIMVSKFKEVAPGTVPREKLSEVIPAGLKSFDHAVMVVPFEDIFYPGRKAPAADQLRPEIKRLLEKAGAKMVVFQTLWKGILVEIKPDGTLPPPYGPQLTEAD